jgi:hypothetical protein
MWTAWKFGRRNRRKASTMIASNQAVIWSGKFSKINLQVLSLHYSVKAERCTTWSIPIFRKSILPCHNVSLGGPQSQSGRRGENSWPYRDSYSDPSVVQSVASRYTDYANVSHCTFDYLQLAVNKYDAAAVYSFVTGPLSQYFHASKASQSQVFRENINLYQ